MSKVTQLHIYTTAARERLAQILLARFSSWHTVWCAAPELVVGLEVIASDQQPTTVHLVETSGVLSVQGAKEFRSWIVTHLLNASLPVGPLPLLMERWADEAILAFWRMLTDSTKSNLKVQALDGRGTQIGTDVVDIKLISDLGELFLQLPKGAVNWSESSKFEREVKANLVDILGQVECKCDLYLPSVSLLFSEVLDVSAGDVIVLDTPIQRAKVSLRYRQVVLAECEVSTQAERLIRVLRLVDR